MSRWHRRHELLSFGYRLTVFLWWYVSIGVSVVTLALFGVKTYEWVYWVRLPVEPQLRAVWIFCAALFVGLVAVEELGWLSGTTRSTDRRLRGQRPRLPPGSPKRWVPGAPRGDPDHKKGPVPNEPSAGGEKPARR